MRYYKPTIGAGSARCWRRRYTLVWEVRLRRHRIWGWRRVRLFRELSLLQMPPLHRFGVRALCRHPSRKTCRDEWRWPIDDSGHSGNHDALCLACGSLLYSLVREAAWVHVAMGYLVDALTIRPTHHIFVGSKAACYQITDDLPQYDEHK